MLKRYFDPRKAYRVVIYLRMSSDRQNPRSPDQQLAEIKKRLKALHLPWVIIKVYRDDAQSGLYLRKRAQFQAMLQDLRTGTVVADLILVDTIERFARVEELPSIRKELFEKHGVLLLSADTNFCDPTTPQGKALGMFEAMRASEDGRIKAHNVLRGKRDTANRKFWPGGPVPFGLRLRSVTTERGGKVEVEGSVLEPEPEQGWIITLTFQKAYEDGLGQHRLTHYLNAHPDIPAKFKPFQPATVGHWLQNPIYKGVLLWEQNCTGVVDDTRVLERNAPEDMLLVENFCEPLVDPVVWDAVNGVRKARADRIAAARRQGAEGDGKQIEAPAPGLSLRYPLTGLVRCGHCLRALTPSSSPLYTTKAGEQKRYVAYVCPGSLAKICDNGKRVPEDWLRRATVAKMRERLFPLPERECPAGNTGATADLGTTKFQEVTRTLMEAKDLLATAWFPSLAEEVRQELVRLSEGRPDQRPALETELEQQNERIKGLSISLGNPNLGASVRAALEVELEEALSRKQELEGELAERVHRSQHYDELLDPEQVIRQLNRLDEVLVSHNPTRLNLELALHIDRIDCFGDGKVVLRTCKLGALTAAVDLLADEVPAAEGRPLPGVEGVHRAKPRRRAKLRIEAEAADGTDLRAAAHLAADPDRFAGLDERWFWEDTFEIPEKTCWSEENAKEVARMLRDTGWSLAKLAKAFGKSIPTIRRALRLAGPEV